MKAKFSLLLFSTVIIIYLTELFLSFSLLIHLRNNSTLPENRIQFAEAQGISFDARSPLQVVMDLRSSGITAYPVTNPHNYISSDGLFRENTKVYPFGSISGKTVVRCNENGEFLITKNDEHGFDNPEGLYSGESAEIVLIGDSFAYGNCVKSDENIAGWLRRSGKKVLNLGMGAIGPLIELGILQEYAKPAKPKFVFWFYYEGNDHLNLEDEKKSPSLVKYLDRDYSQGLMNKQELIDGLIIEYAERRIASGKKENETNEINNNKSGKENALSWTQIAKLSQLRDRLKTIKGCFFPVDPLFRDILAEARDRVNASGGRMYLVYLPAIDRYIEKSVRCSKYGYTIHKKKILSIAEDLGIPVIDVQESLNSHHDIYSLFPFRLEFRGHFNADGYRFVSQQLLKQIQAEENK